MTRCHPLAPYRETVVIPAMRRGGEQRAIGRQQERSRQRARQRVLLEVRIDHAQRVALDQAQARRLRPASTGAVMLVMDDRVGSEPDLVAEQPQPPAELDIFVVGERPLVPGAGVEKHVARHQHRRAARKQQRRLPPRREPGRIADVMLKAAPFEAHGSATEINQLAVPVENAAADARGLVSCGHGQKLAEPVGMDARVVVEKHQVLAARGACPDVVGGRESEVRTVADDAGARIGALDRRGRILGRSVVDDDDLASIAWMALRGDRAETLGEVRRAKRRQDDDRHHRCVWSAARSSVQPRAGRRRRGRRRRRAPASGVCKRPPINSSTPKSAISVRAICS